MRATPRQHREATLVSSSTTSLEPFHSLTSRTQVGIMAAEGELSGRSRNAHDAQLAGWEMESDFTHRQSKETRCEGKTTSVVSQIQMCQTRVTLFFSFFFYRIKSFFLPLCATSVQINATHATKCTRLSSSLPSTLQQTLPVYCVYIRKCFFCLYIFRTYP